MSEFSNLLASTITELGLTQVAAEERTGIDRTVLSKLMSGAIAPSTSNLASLCKKLNPKSAVGYDLLFAYLRDQVALVGLPVNTVSIHLRDAGSPDAWWKDLSESRAARLRTLEDAARADDTFDRVLADLEPLALKLQGALSDAKELGKIKRGEVYAFPRSESKAVAESAPKKWKAPPPGRSQQPTA